MYTIIDYKDKRILRKDKYETKYFIVNNEIVKFPKSGIVYFPVGTQITVSKMLHFVRHQIEMATNKSSLHHNAIIEKYGVGNRYEIDETEKIMASLEVVEIL